MQEQLKVTELDNFFLYNVARYSKNIMANWQVTPLEYC